VAQTPGEGIWGATSSVVQEEVSHDQTPQEYSPFCDESVPTPISFCFQSPDYPNHWGVTSLVSRLIFPLIASAGAP